MKRMTNKEFNQNSGKFCPVCRGSNLEIKIHWFLEIEMLCNDCGTEYNEIHKMHSYKITRKGRK